MEYILLTLANWAPDPDTLFQYLSGWHLLVGAGLILIVMALAFR